MKSTIHVDGQPEQFETTIPKNFRVVSSTIDEVFHFFTEAEAVLAYDEIVRQERAILAVNIDYKFLVALWEGHTLRRKTTKK